MTEKIVSLIKWLEKEKEDAIKMQETTTGYCRGFHAGIEASTTFTLSKLKKFKRYLVVSFNTDNVFDVHGSFDNEEDAKECCNAQIMHHLSEVCPDDYQCTYQIYEYEVE